MQRELRAVLQQYAGSVQLGDVPEEPQPNEQLRKDLEAVLKRHRQTFYILYGAVVLVFVVALIAAIFYVNNPQMIAALFTATGVGLAWAIAQMRKLWKEQVQIELILVLLPQMRPAAFRSVINILLSGLK